MKTKCLVAVGAMALLIMTGCAASAQGHTQFDDKDRQNTTDWYNQNKDHAPEGFRAEDRLTADQESRLKEGAVLDPDLRAQVHPVPADLGSRLPAPPSDHRYVAIGGHVGLIDNNYQVKSLIRLH